MPQIERISPQESSQKLEQGAWLICAYEDEHKCASILIQGALSVKDFRNRLSNIPYDREIIFY